ncbi:magnesium transporter [Pilibacter termitis]|uniref:Magnesium transporter n=1 Tax=Pilibacter termitis TaxID=263852 RepID=A0A1T4M8B1_9ENTE|nr:magnesium transporter CorA family protein [Pilibacter termitis]SJZ63162.1 magnesium transporter [Pilibacter termitis]
MKTIYQSTVDTFREIEESQNGSWIKLVNPTQKESLVIADRYNIDIEDLRAPLDLEERSRITVEDNYTMILVDIPMLEDRNKKEWYTTIPLGIIITNEVLITTCLQETRVLDDFENGRVKDFYTFMKTRFIFQILYKNAKVYLQYLRAIDRKSSEVEKKLHQSTKNEELIELLELEKSLVYFTTSLRTNERVLEKLVKLKSIKKYPDDEDLLEDTIVENQQAMEMASIYGNILSGMMDAFASVISNNQNIIMKVLALITIVMSIPTMIFSAYGMNVEGKGMPFAESPFGFWIIICISFVISIFTTVYFIWKKWF